MNTMKDLLSSRLPPEFIGKRSGEVSIYALGPALDYRPQTVHEWIRKNRIPVVSICRLMSLPNTTLTLEDFRPFCADLSMILSVIEGSKSENKEIEADAQ